MVLTGNSHLPETVALLSQSQIPVVETWSISDPIIDMAVGFSVYEAALAMGRLLVEKGYRRIGFAGFLQSGTNRFPERQHGFQKALQEKGLNDSYVFFGNEAEGFAGGRIRS